MMALSTESIKTLIETKGITKPALLAARLEGRSWKEIQLMFKTRRTNFLQAAHYLGIDTSKKVAELRPPILKPKIRKPFVKLPAAAIRRVKEAISLKKAFRTFYRVLKKKDPDKAQGWYVHYEQEVCEQSPPCDPDSPNTRWELHTQKASWFENEPNLDLVRDEILERNGFLWRTRNWKMVYSSYKGKIRESKQTR